MKKSMAHISRKNHQLLHMQIKDELLKEYSASGISENTPFPSERELVKKFNTSKVTIEKVFKELKKDNIIYSVPNLGTFWGKKKNITRYKTVGVCFPVKGSVSQINSPYYFSMLGGIEDVFSNHGLNIKLLRFENIETIDSIREAHCDAFICTGTRNSVLPTVDNFRKLNIPYLLLDRPNNDETLNYLERDSAGNIEGLVDYLVSKGHWKICCVGQIPDLWIYKKLYIGFENGMKKHKLDFSRSVMQVPDFSHKTLAKNKLSGMIKKHSALMILTPSKDAIETILRYCEDNNIGIPSDCSIISLAMEEVIAGGKSVSCHVITPHEMGIEAAKGIMRLLKDEYPVHIDFSTRITDKNTLVEIKKQENVQCQ